MIHVPSISSQMEYYKHIEYFQVDILIPNIFPLALARLL